MSKNIKLSPKHGLNPSLQLCLYCRKAKSILLNGKIGKDDLEASKEVVTDIEPCDKCKEKYKDCTLVVELNKNDIPTGRWLAIDKKYITEETVKNSQVAIATEETFNSILEADEDGKNDIK